MAGETGERNAKWFLIHRVTIRKKRFMDQPVTWYFLYGYGSGKKKKKKPKFLVTILILKFRIVSRL